jgi:hypothetical protein
MPKTKSCIPPSISVDGGPVEFTITLVERSLDDDKPS